MIKWGYVMGICHGDVSWGYLELEMGKTRGRCGKNGII
jgi:hypothetical protein